jgi:hypothetical protein
LGGKSFKENASNVRRGRHEALSVTLGSSAERYRTLAALGNRFNVKAL